MSTPAPTLYALDEQNAAVSSEPLSFYKILDAALLKISDQCLTHLTTTFASKPPTDLQKYFLNLETLSKSPPQTRLLATKIHRFIFEKSCLFGFQNAVEIIEKNKLLCLPIECTETLLKTANQLQHTSPSLWDKIFQSDRNSPSTPPLLAEHADFSLFVFNFNRDFGKRIQMIRIGRTLLADLKRASWKHRNGVPIIPDITKLSWARRALYELYLCQDHEIKEIALRDLIDLLECDPIHMRTAYDLVDLQSRLLSEIQSSKAQNLNCLLQRLLIKAYATSLECILLHANSGHLNAIEEKIKQTLWRKADDFEEFNIIKDPEITLWSEYAVQGGQRIKVEVSSWKAWMPRIFKIGNAFMQIYTLIEEPEQIFSVIEEIVKTCTEAYEQLEFHEAWFEELMMLRRVARLSMVDIQSFQKVSRLFRNIKRSSTHPNVLYGAVSCLETVIRYTPVRWIQEEALKLLIQHLTQDNLIIQKRVVDVLASLLAGSTEQKNTAFLILRILDASGYLQEESLWRGVKRSSYYNKMIKDTSANFKTSIVQELYTNVIKFLIRRICEIKGDRDQGGHSFITLVCDSTDKTIIVPLLKCFSGLSPLFCKPDVYGFSPFHIGASKKNLTMIRYAHEAGVAEINAKDFYYSNTALHTAAKSAFSAGVSLLLELGADPNIENQDGELPLHLSVRAGDLKATSLLMENTADPNNLNTYGETALNIAIKADNPVLVELLIKKGSKLAEHINQVSPVIFAARNNAEKTLVHLIETKTTALTKLEALEIINMITRDGETLNASEEFCRFHLKKAQTDKQYAKVFKPFRTPPLLQQKKNNDHPSHIRMNSGETFKTHNNKLIYKAAKLNADRETVYLDAYHNTPLILLARSPSLADSLKAHLNTHKDISEQNVLGISPLHVAVIHRNHKAAALLLETEKAEIEKRDIRGFRALHFAALNGDPILIKLLLEHKANPNVKNDFGDTPFLLACGNYPIRIPESLHSIGLDSLSLPSADASLEAIKMLIESGAKVKIMDAMGNNALHHAVCNGSEETIRFLYKTYPALTWKKNKKGLLPIEEALLNKRKINLSKLLENKPLLDLHQEFIKNTNRRLTLGNLLAYAGEENLLKGLFEKDQTLAYFSDSTPYKHTPLHIAAKKGNTKIVDVYTSLSLDLHTADGFGNTPAHIACLEEQEHFLAALIESEANFHTKNLDGRTPLHFAAMRGNMHMVKQLSQCSNLLHERDGNGCLPLHLACKFKRHENVPILFEAYPEGIGDFDDDLNTPLHHACSSGDVQIVKYLLSKRADQESQNVTGETPLSIAALNGDAKVVQTLIKAGCNIASEDIEKETPLHKAIFQQHLQVTRLLLEADSHLVKEKSKSYINHADIDLETPIHELVKLKAKCRKRPEISGQLMCLLLDYGADIGHQNRKGENFLHLLCREGLDGLFQECLRYMGAGKFEKKLLISRDGKGNSLLHKAAAGDHVEIAEILITQRIPLELKNAKGETALFSAVRRGHYSFAKMLLEHGACLKQQNIEGQSLLHVLLEKKSVDKKGLQFLNHVLQQKPTALYTTDKQGYTLLHVCADNNHLNVIAWILNNLPKDPATNQQFILAKSKNGLTAQEIAAEKHHRDLERMLRTLPKDKL